MDTPDILYHRHQPEDKGLHITEDKGRYITAWNIKPGKFFVYQVDLYEILEDYHRLCELEQSLPI